jgi:hypothetical protein
MKTPRNTVVNAKTVDSLLNERNGRFIARPGFAGTNIRMYLLNDGGALVVFPDGRGRHWESYDEMMKYSHSSEEETFRDVLPLGKDFVRSVPRMIDELPQLIGINGATLDGSERSIESIDEAIERLGIEEILTPDVLQSVTAYVGEVIRRAINGRWESGFERSGHGEPDIIDRRGNPCNLLRIYKEILEHGSEGSVSAFARHAIRHHQS